MAYVAAATQSDITRLVQRAWQLATKYEFSNRYTNKLQITIRVLRTDQSSRRHANERAGSDKQLPVQSAGKGTALMLP